MKYRRKRCIFFVIHKKCIEKKIEQLFGESKKIFRNIFCIALIGLIASGKHAWQEEEETRKDSSTVLILLEQLCIPELFKDIQDAILLILRYKTHWLFRATSSSTFTMSDVLSICILSQIQDWYLEDKIWATDRQYSLCLLILRTKITRILMWSTWVYRVVHNTCIKHGKDIKTQCIGSTSIMLWRRIKILSDSIECNHPSRNTSSLLYSESCKDGNWRSQKRESFHVTSASTKDLFETRMEKIIGFRTCSATRSWATI